MSDCFLAGHVHVRYLSHFVSDGSGQMQYGGWSKRMMGSDLGWRDSNSPTGFNGRSPPQPSGGMLQLDPSFFSSFSRRLDRSTLERRCFGHSLVLPAHGIASSAQSSMPAMRRPAAMANSTHELPIRAQQVSPTPVPHIGALHTCARRDSAFVRSMRGLPVFPWCIKSSQISAHELILLSILFFLTCSLSVERRHGRRSPLWPVAAVEE